MAELPPIPHRDTIKRDFFDPSRKQNLPAGVNPGLVFDRYLPAWEMDRATWRVDTKSDVLEWFVSNLVPANAPSGWDLEWLANIHARLDALLPHGSDSTPAEGRLQQKTSARLAIGLGADHPLENSITLDYSIGVPIIPGSAIKGLCRAWCTIHEVSSEKLEDLFGATPESGHASSGTLTFLPAHPLAPEKSSVHFLDVEIVNPHQPKYYREAAKPRPSSAKLIPDPTDNPMPIRFLTVPRGVTFVFRILPSPRSSSADVADAIWVLQAALEELGVGAKTAAGYGTFGPMLPDPDYEALLQRLRGES
jgi:CRISPR-associated protein Cmr6